MSIENLPVTPKGKATRERLLVSARAVALKSIGKVEIAAVAKDANVAQSLINRYFGSKAGLVAALVNDYFARLTESVLDLDLDDQGTWAEREFIRLQKGVQFHYSDPFSVVMYSQLAKDPEVMALEARRVKDIISRGARNIRKGQKAGELPVGIDPGIAAAALFGSLTQVMLEVMTRATRPSQKSVVAALWRQVCAAVQIEFKKI